MEIKSVDGQIIFLLEPSGEIDGRLVFDSVLLEGEFNEVNFSGFHFKNGNFDDSVFLHSMMENTYFGASFIAGSVFSHSNFRNATFYLVFGPNAIFSKSQLSGAKFLGGTFTEADFSECDLTNASFISDNIGGEIFLHGANFMGAKLDGVKFECAVYDEFTKFPGSFDPKLHGLIKINS